MAYEGYAQVELMGHRVRCGKISEEESYGSKFLRIDIPFESGVVTEYYGGSAIYAITPLSEEICKDRIGKHDPRPVQPLQYRLEDKTTTKPSVFEDADEGDY